MFGDKLKIHRCAGQLSQHSETSEASRCAVKYRFGPKSELMQFIGKPYSPAETVAALHAFAAEHPEVVTGKEAD